MKYFALLASLAGLAAAEAPNLVQQDFPDVRTAAQNTSYFIVAVPRSTAESLVSPYPLLDVPGDNATLFPQGWDDAFHPIVMSTSLQNQIKLRAGINLNIDQLLGSGAYVPYTDVLRDGQSAIQYPIRNFIGGVNQNDLMSVVPSLVATLTGNPLRPASFDPTNQAYTTSPGGTQSTLVDQIILPNPLSGPGVEGPAWTLTSTPGANAMYTTQTYITLNNQPLLQTGLGGIGALLGRPMCQRNAQIFFYDGFEGYQEPELRTGRVRFGDRSVVPRRLAREDFQRQGCLTHTVQIVGFNAESCADAVANVWSELR